MIFLNLKLRFLIYNCHTICHMPTYAHLTWTTPTLERHLTSSINPKTILKNNKYREDKY